MFSADWVAACQFPTSTSYIVARRIRDLPFPNKNFKERTWLNSSKAEYTLQCWLQTEKNYPESEKYRHQKITGPQIFLIRWNK